jgi:uncharacterized protein YutE (UPF0331/DUF86 family)
MSEAITTTIIGIIYGISGGIILQMISELIKRKKRQKGKYEFLIQRLGVDSKSVEDIVKRTRESENYDQKATFLVLAIDLEKSIRSYGERALSVADFSSSVAFTTLIDALKKYNVLDEEWMTWFKRLWDIRNKVVHGLSVSDTEIKWGIFLAAVLLADLEKLRKRVTDTKSNKSQGGM